MKIGLTSKKVNETFHIVMTIFNKNIIFEPEMDHRVKDIEIETLLAPETKLEQAIISVPTFREGLLWGVPRYGHPEGQIVNHIVDVYANIDKLQLSASDRRNLRLIALTHDTFKYAEDKSTPRDWSKHHGILARQFLSQFSVDEHILEIVELHDEAYYIWRLLKLYKKPLEGQKRLKMLLDRLGKHLQLFYMFFKCDTATGDKIPTPVIWFEQNIEGIHLVKFA